MSPANAIINYILAPIALVGLFALGAAIDAQPDAREETANALALQDAQAAAAQEQRKQLAAYQLCKQDHGPNVAAAWNFEGVLVCQPKRGPERVMTAQSAMK